MPGWGFIKLNKEFVFPDPEAPIINILYDVQEFVVNSDCYFMFSFVTSSKLIISIFFITLL